MSFRSCVSPEGKFICAIHRPHYCVTNLRHNDHITTLGKCSGGAASHDNRVNFPARDVEVREADPIFEIPNAFPFHGTTYIGKKWADAVASDPLGIALPAPESTSCSAFLEGLVPGMDAKTAFQQIPRTMRLALAATSTDPLDLSRLAAISCDIIFTPDTDSPAGLLYQKDAKGRARPIIHDHDLFETLVNNPHLPDSYKEVMVLRPGVQGDSEIVGEYGPSDECHVFEYLRRNSYIPWGHYASNMANDSIRYAIASLSEKDMTGLRHLYYQRTYVRMAQELGLPAPSERRAVMPDELEIIRQAVLGVLAQQETDRLLFTATLWGWNYGFDFAPSGYRLHASHQQIHQQFALVPRQVRRSDEEGFIASYACGDMIGCFIENFRQQTGKDFFASYIKAVGSNTRLDQRTDRSASLVVYEDDNILLFAPKAQTSQWELQLMTKKEVGNILEADRSTRESLDKGLYLAMRSLTGLGARMITTIEYSKRFNSADRDHRLLYCFLPKLPQSPGAFSEAQMRFITGHYPEDFATACRSRLTS